MEVYNTEIFCKIMLVNEALFGQSEKQLETIMREVGTTLDFDFHDFYLCLTGLGKKVYTSYLNMHRQDYVRIFQEFKPRITELAQQRGIRQINAVINYDSSKQIIYLISKDHHTEQEIIRFAEEIQKELQQQYEKVEAFRNSSLENFTVLSNLIGSYDQMAREFESVRQLSRMSFFRMEPVVFMQFMMNSRPADWKQLREQVEKLETAIFDPDRKKLQLIVQDLFRFQLKNSFRFDLCHIVVNDLNQLIARLQQQLHGSQIMNEPMLHLEDYACIEDLEKEVYRILAGYQMEVASDYHRMSEVTQHAIQWIKKNYMKEIGLQEVADHLKLAPSYLSRTFSRDLKITMNAYITRLRIERAKILLMETTDRISEIAEKVGIQSGDYFSVLFKKNTGMRPQEYRDCYRK